MTKKILLIIFFAFFSQANYLYAQCKTENKAFKSNEKLEFTGYYQLGFIWLNFGKIKINVTDTIYENKPALKIMGDGRNAKAYDMFFKLRDTLTTIVSKENLSPFYLDRKTHEGDYYARHVYKYDIPNNKIHIYKTKRNKKTKHSVISFEGCVNNLMSILHHVRNIDYDKYTPGSNIPVQLIVDGEISKVFVRYHGVEKLRSKHCPKVQCYKITPVMPKGGLFESGEGMYIWLTKDKNKLPLMVEAEIPVGSVKGILRRYENLKNEDNLLGNTTGEIKR